MGASISWAAFRGIDKDEVLRRLARRDTGENAWPGESEFCGAQLANSWYVAVSSHEEFTPERLTALSRGCKVVGCGAEEHVMVSAAWLCRDGALVWSIAHDPENGPLDLTIEGEPPEGFAAIRDDLLKQQHGAGGEASDTDYIFDIPVAVAATVCGYRHDSAEDLSRPFTRLESTETKGWLRSLFNRR